MKKVVRSKHGTNVDAFRKLPRAVIGKLIS